MYTITKNSYISFDEVEIGELFECAGGLFVRIHSVNKYDELNVFALCITVPTKSPMNDGRVSRGHISPFELDCPVGKVILEEFFRQSTQDNK